MRLAIHYKNRRTGKSHAVTPHLIDEHSYRPIIDVTSLEAFKETFEKDNNWWLIDMEKSRISTMELLLAK